jgi:hypothetical protein
VLRADLNRLAPLAVMGLLQVGACTKRNPIYCDEGLPCETPGTVCDVPTNTCVPINASVDANDGVDANDRVDADTGGPIAVTHQAADLVLGQPGFDSEGDVGCTASSAKVGAVAEGNGVLYGREVAERVLGWMPPPVGSNAPAVFALGKSSLTDCAVNGPVDAVHFGPTGGLSIANGKFLLADTAHNRVMVWGSPPTVNASSALYVLGQASILSESAGTGANQMSFPTGVWTDGKRVVVADQLNHRVLIWRTFPNMHGQPADVVIGQQDFGQGSVPSSPTAANMSAPSGVVSDGTRLFVADSGHRRVLIWQTFPDSNGTPADVVLGHDDFTTGGGGLSATRMSGPHGLAIVDDALFVADLPNNRVLVWSPVPTTNGEPATVVLGQSSLDLGADTPPTSQSLSRPRNLSIADDHLWVTDEGHNRLLRYSLYPQQP